MMGTRPFAHGWAEPFEWPPAMSDVAVRMALVPLTCCRMFRPVRRPVGWSSLLLLATPASRESIDGAAVSPVRTPLGELQLQRTPGAATPTELHQLRNEQQAARRRAAGPGSRQQESESAPSLINAAEQLGCSLSLKSLAAPTTKVNGGGGLRIRSRSVRAGSASMSENAAHQLASSDIVRPHGRHPLVSRTRMLHPARATVASLTQLAVLRVSDADRLLEYQHRCSGAPISANSRRVAALKEAGQDLSLYVVQYVDCPLYGTHTSFHTGSQGRLLLGHNSHCMHGRRVIFLKPARRVANRTSLD
jgi:hypothetical protein